MVLCWGGICFRQDHLVPHQITRQQTIGSEDGRNKVSKRMAGVGRCRRSPLRVMEMIAILAKNAAILTKMAARVVDD